ncbi:GntR family transcriptional regulator [Oceanirhabdus sp. W0125-5]|nr:DeoR family transcriptional regulator [Oceanirhabdus sp. W0125-5]WBW99731.1 GntR family transcriptional regulator [Oceanirhabdus sp. W0125-5]
MIENEVLEGNLKENERVYSTNEMAKFFSINPATARKGLNILTQEGIIYKKRGLGMFISPEAHDVIMKKRKAIFLKNHVNNFLIEASKLGITKDELIELIKAYKII